MLLSTQKPAIWVEIGDGPNRIFGIGKFGYWLPGKQMPEDENHDGDMVLNVALLFHHQEL